MTIQDMARLSPLHETHLSVNATFRELSSWQVALSFAEEASELSAVREGIGLSDLSDRAKVMVEGRASAELLRFAFALPELAINGGAAVGDEIYVYRLRQDQFYLSAPTSQEGVLQHTLNSVLEQVDGLVTMTDVTNGRAELLVVGPQSAECLSRLCGLDFHESQFPNQTAKQSSLAKTRQLIMRRDLGAIPAYYISGGRSFAAYLWKIILEAGQDLAIRPIGRKVLVELGL